ncbi:kinase-like domain-containing protein [Rhizophagus irregularis DAOM 181602=DAOM 197198]|nr:kinase-like domain-containing protein [Rhizophagus irregularis DAOM 181602=DAOM 197198]
MKQCWNAVPSKRLDIYTFRNKISEINLFYQENCTSSSKLFTSKLHQFDNLPEPRNATEEEQEAFHSNKSYDFYIPNNVDDFNKSSSKKNSTSKIGTIFEDSSKNLSNIFKRSSKNEDYKVESMRKRIKKLHINDNDEYEAHNNPNLHSEEQDELELPENI